MKMRRNMKEWVEVQNLSMRMFMLSFIISSRVDLTQPPMGNTDVYQIQKLKENLDSYFDYLPEASA